MIKLRKRVNRTLDTALMSPKEIYPEMHQKTHFKAVYEMFVTPTIGNGIQDEILKKAIRVPPKA